MLALRSFINGKQLELSSFAGGGIMAGSRPVAIRTGPRDGKPLQSCP
jgi:hypothetical protein